MGGRLAEQAVGLRQREVFGDLAEIGACLSLVLADALHQQNPAADMDLNQIGLPLGGTYEAAMDFEGSSGLDGTKQAVADVNGPRDGALHFDEAFVAQVDGQGSGQRMENAGVASGRIESRIGAEAETRDVAGWFALPGEEEGVGDHLQHSGEAGLILLVIALEPGDSGTIVNVGVEALRFLLLLVRGEWHTVALKDAGDGTVAGFDMLAEKRLPGGGACTEILPVDEGVAVVELIPDHVAGELLRGFRWRLWLLRGEGYGKGNGQERDGEFSGFGHQVSRPNNVIQQQRDGVVWELREIWLTIG